MFVKWIKFINIDIVYDILFFDEIYFYLIGIVNKINVCYLGSEKFNFYFEKFLYGEKEIVCLVG